MSTTTENYVEPTPLTLDEMRARGHAVTAPTPGTPWTWTDEAYEAAWRALSPSCGCESRDACYGECLPDAEAVLNALGPHVAEILAAREAAAEQRGAERALRSAADELRRLLDLGWIQCSEITEGAAAEYDANAPHDADSVVPWLHARAAGAYEPEATL